MSFSKGRAFWILAALLALMIQGSAFAGVTGKIAGTIKDASTGEPLMGVNVMIPGTMLGAVTDADGSYFIINIPPGDYSLQASVIGHEKTVKTDIRVNSDHTTPVDFSMKSTVLEGASVTVVAEREIVKKDISSTQIVATTEEVKTVPFVNSVAGYVQMQAGVDGSLIRGGGLDQQGFMVDGLSVVDNRTNQPLRTVNLSTIKEVNIIKGGFGAEYGNVRSGMISVVTKDPDPNQYAVSIDVRFTPARLKHYGPSMFSKDFFYTRSYMDPAVAFVGTAKGGWDSYKKAQNMPFEGWNSFSAKLLADKDLKNNRTPQECYDMFMWEHTLEGSAALGQKEGTYGDKPDYLGDVSFSGPIPLIGKYLGNLSFLASHRMDWQQFMFRVSRDYFKDSNSYLKLTSRFAKNMKLSVEGFYGEVETVAGSREGGSDNSYAGSATDIRTRNYTPGGMPEDHKVGYWPEAAVPFDIYRGMIGLTFDHVLSPKTFYNIRISQVHVKNSAKAWGSDAYRDTTTLRYFGSTSVDERPYGFWIGTGQTITFQGDGASANADGGGHRDDGEVYTLNARIDLTSQFNRYNQIKAGVEFNYDDIHTDYQRLRFESAWENYRNVWDHFPWRASGYLQDKIEFEGMVANIGVRMEYSNPNTDWYTTDPYSKYFSNKYKDLLTAEAPTEKAEARLMILPRLGISHPISENVKLYFSYNHLTNLPSTYRMYEIRQGRASDGIVGLGNPNMLLQREVAYELGFEWNIASQFLVQLSGFYRDIQDQQNDVTYTNYTGSVSYTTYMNNNYQDIRGFELRIDKQFGRWVTGWFNYTYPVTQSGFLGRNTYYQDPRLAAIQGLVDPNIDRTTIRPYWRASLNLWTPMELGPALYGVQPLGGWMVQPNVTWRSGIYETWNPLNKEGVRNDLHWKASWGFDMRFGKRWRVSKAAVELFADINNVFNLKYLASNAHWDEQDRRDYRESLHLPQYANPEYDTVRDLAKGKYVPGNDQVGDVKSKSKPYINMPNKDFMWYQDLRYATFGLRIDF